MPKTIAFVCVHNSCRSQMAEAIAKIKFASWLIPYSAGTHPVAQINQDAVKIIKEIYDYDMERDQYSKTIDVLPTIEILITMGCNVDCPYLPCQVREDWGLDDPAGQPREAFIKTVELIEAKMADLVARIANGAFLRANSNGSST